MKIMHLITLKVCFVRLYHKNEVLEREKKNPIYKKNLLESGYPNFDNLKNYFANESTKGQILIAPTWGENSITNLCHIV